MSEFVIIIIAAIIGLLMAFPVLIFPTIVILFVIGYLYTKKVTKRENRTSAFVSDRTDQLGAPTLQTYEHDMRSIVDERAVPLAGPSYPSAGAPATTFDVAEASPTSQASLDLQSMRDAMDRGEAEKRAAAAQTAAYDLANAASRQNAWDRIEGRIRKASPQRSGLLSAVIMAEILGRRGQSGMSRRNPTH